MWGIQKIAWPFLITGLWSIVCSFGYVILGKIPARSVLREGFFLSLHIYVMHYSIEPSNEDECAIPAFFQLTHIIGDGGGDVPSIRSGAERTFARCDIL